MGKKIPSISSASPERLRQVVFILLFFAIVLFGGTFGYMVFENTGFWDGMYLTIITVFTVGYGDMVPIHPSGKVFTVFLVCAGVSFVMYTFSKITETMVEGGLRNIFERKKMDKKIARMHDHYIVCGFGRIGKEICRVLKESNRQFLVVERDDEEIKNIEDKEYIAFAGEASDDEILIKAGIERAKGLIAVVSTDADNLYITLTARGLNHNLFILARSSGTPGAKTKLLRAGASKVISPYSIGARRMAHLIVRPTVIDFIDLTMQAGELGLCMEELHVSEKALFVNKPLVDSGIRRNHNIIVVAIKRESGEMIYNPGPDIQLLCGDILVVLGEHDQIIALEKEV